jgi:hypothetical protein
MRWRRRLAAQGLAVGWALSLPVVAAAAGSAVGAGAPPASTAWSEPGRVAQWVRDSGDNRRRPFIIIDKAHARVLVFDARGVLKGAEAALLGLGRGDKLRPGATPMAQLDPADRITPSGRFLANLDRDAHGQQILLIDYEHAIALHPVVKGTVAERRAERLASATTEDNRISFGCINVPAAFFRDVVSEAFARSDGFVYILPESGGTPLF